MGVRLIIQIPSLALIFEAVLHIYTCAELVSVCLRIAQLSARFHKYDYVCISLIICNCSSGLIPPFSKGGYLSSYNKFKCLSIKIRHRTYEQEHLGISKLRILQGLHQSFGRLSQIFQKEYSPLFERLLGLALRKSVKQPDLLLCLLLWDHSV